MIAPTSEGLVRKVAMLRERAGGLDTVLGIVFRSYEVERIEAILPVTPHLHQPFGIMHGGASLVLAESIASVGAWLSIDDAVASVVGIEINANHLRSVREGELLGVGVPLHRGRTTQVWEVKIHRDADQQLVCVSRCTIGIVPRRDR